MRKENDLLLRVEKRKSQRRTASSQVLPAAELIEQYRRKKKRAIGAVYPYTQLSEEESQLTVMMKLFGERFSKWWFRRKRIMLRLGALSSLIFPIFLFLGFLDLTPPPPTIISALFCFAYLVNEIFLLLWRYSVANYGLVRKLLHGILPDRSGLVWYESLGDKVLFSLWVCTQSRCHPWPIREYVLTMCILFRYGVHYGLATLLSLSACLHYLSYWFWVCQEACVITAWIYTKGFF